MGQLYRREDGGNWQVSFSVNGQQFRETTHTAKYNEAVSFLKKRISDIQTGAFTSTKTDRLMVPTLLQAVVDDYIQKGRERGLRKGVRQMTERLAERFKHMRAANLTTAHLRAYVRDRQAEGAEDASINRELAVLRRAYTIGVTDKTVAVANVPSFRDVLLAENNVRQGFWEHGEYLAFREALTVDSRPVFIFGYWTGCRYSEITHLLWEQVDLEGRAVRLRETQTKNKEPRIIPLGGPGADLYDMLAAQKARHASLCPSSPWVFFRHGSKVKRLSMRRGQRVSEIKKEWYAAQEATGIGRSFHDLRRTGVRNLIRAGVPQSIAKRISGHKTDAVFARYNIVDERDLHDAADKLNKHMAAKAAGKGE
jgi:integrase